MIAHELGHIKNRDTLLMTITATIAGAISMLANFGFMFGGRSNDNNNIGFDRHARAAHPRRRSPRGWCRWRSAGRANTRPTARAPRSAASRCALASALQKIAGAAHRIPNMPAERNPASAHLFIVNPLSGARMDNLFSTHPNVENRVARLQEIAREMGESGPSASARARCRRAVVAPQRRVAGRGPWG